MKQVQGRDYGKLKRRVEKGSGKHRQAVIVTYWTVWYTRNQVIHEGIVHSDYNTLSFVVVFLREYDVINPSVCLRPLRNHGN
ncbi:hypothetical protein V6N13_137101 [Hibiscus sabdariffa]